MTQFFDFLRHQKSSHILLCLILMTVLILIGFLLGISFGDLSHKDQNSNLNEEIFSEVMNIAEKIIDANEEKAKTRGRAAMFSEFEVGDNNLKIANRFIHTWKHVTNKTDSCLDLCLETPIDANIACHFVAIFSFDDAKQGHACAFGNFMNSGNGFPYVGFNITKHFLRRNSYGKHTKYLVIYIQNQKKCIFLRVSDICFDSQKRD